MEVLHAIRVPMPMGSTTAMVDGAPQRRGVAMSAHTPDCALVLYARVDPVTLKAPLECDCDAGDDSETEPNDAEAAADHAAGRVQPSGPTAMLTGPAAIALNTYRKVAVEYRKVKARHDAALATLTEELAK